MQFQCVMFINKAFIHLNDQWRHSLQSAIPITKLAKSGMWHCHLQWQWSCVTYMQEGYQLPMERGWSSCSLLIARPRANIQINWLYNNAWAFENGLPLFWYILYIETWYNKVILMVPRTSLTALRLVRSWTFNCTSMVRWTDENILWTMDVGVRTRTWRGCPWWVVSVFEHAQRPWRQTMVNARLLSTHSNFMFQLVESLAK